MKRKLILKKSQKIFLLCILPFAAAGALLLAAVLYQRYIMPYVPPCYLRTLTGYRCPSCGMTHAVYALCRLDFAEVLRQNAMLLFGVLLGVLYYAEQWTRALGCPKKIIPRRSGFWIAALIGWLAYTVIRNL
ncbi:MAG: DUF2752 domain-containing protein [Oscillospiraceae bacterium]|nr:DUF2752 domain-containing protein [Oscillospiraceae bacterium]